MNVTVLFQISFFDGCFFFFFSSRRRHTRLVSDWSSDVCSSDLISLRGGKDFLIQPVCILHATILLFAPILWAVAMAPLGPCQSIPPPEVPIFTSSRNSPIAMQYVRLIYFASICKSAKCIH